MLKHLFLTVGFILTVFSSSPANAWRLENCSINGIKLWGKVQIVSRNADIEIEVDPTFYRFKVKFLEKGPSKCGEWQIVERDADFTVKFVEHFGDLRVTFVVRRPGARF